MLMALRRLLVLAYLLPAVGCLESSYSSGQRPLPAASIEPQAVKPPAASAETDEPAAPVPAKAPAEPATTRASKAPQPTKDITFDDIKFDIEKDAKFERSMLTPKIEELAGSKVRIRGYILPTFQQSGIRNFVLVRDNMECCFGPGAAIYDCIIVDMVAGSTEFSTRPVTVEGELTLREVLDFDNNNITRAIYHLDATGVK
jgi:hypothetical protein